MILFGKMELELLKDFNHIYELEQPLSSRVSPNDSAFYATVFEFLTENKDGDLGTLLTIPDPQVMKNTSGIAVYSFSQKINSDSYKSMVGVFLEDQLTKKEEKLEDLQSRSPTWLQAHIPFGKNYSTTPLFAFDVVAVLSAVLFSPFGLKDPNLIMGSDPLASLELAASIMGLKQFGWGLLQLFGRPEKKKVRKEIELYEIALNSLPEKEVVIYKPQEATKLYKKLNDSKDSLFKLDVNKFNKQMVDVYRSYV